MTPRPPLLLYCQHSLGMGHLVRSLALAGALEERFRVTLLNGGLLPEGCSIPTGVTVVGLPPLGMDQDGVLVSRDPSYTVEEAQQRRRDMILAVFADLRPAVLLIELFPFGRRKFASELLPILDAAHELGTDSPVVVCSLRDILMNGHASQEAYDERASLLANRYFDAVLVHSDPAFARLEDSFCPRTPLGIPVHYTGFVLPAARDRAPSLPARRHEVIVSAGGGLVGKPLLGAAVEAHASLWPAARLAMRLVAGPFCPEEAWRDLSTRVEGREGLSLQRSVPDLAGEMANAAASVSQCGYNTALDIVRARVPALVVPYGDGRENEQMGRARRLERAGALRVLEPDRVDGPTLAREIQLLLRFRPSPNTLEMDGGRRTTRLIEAMAGERAQARTRRVARGVFA